MHLLRCFSFYAALFKFHYSAMHVPGILNTAADALSHNNKYVNIFLSFPTVATRDRDSLLAQQPAGGCAARLGLTAFDQSVHTLFNRGLSSSTRLSYCSGQRRYISFCSQFGLTPFPLQETTICRFIAYLLSVPHTYQSIRCYLSSLRHLQLAQCLPDPHLDSLPRLVYVLRGEHRLSSIPSRRRLPITPDVLMAIYSGPVWVSPMTGRCYGLPFVSDFLDS